MAYIHSSLYLHSKLSRIIVSGFASNCSPAYTSKMIHDPMEWHAYVFQAGEIIVFAAICKWGIVAS